MRLEHISAVLRPRADAEAVDLGLAMVRRHAAGIYKAWFTLLVPLWGLLIALLPDNPSLVVLIAWWLKPVYDRVVLFYLGRALFGAPPTWREQLREWPKMLGRRLGLSLIWGRFSGVRSFTMPVVVLEGLTGKLYKDRTAILKRHGGLAAFGFMQLFVLLELAVILGLWFGIVSWLPEEYTEWFQDVRILLTRGMEPPPGLLWSVAACYLAAVALVEPFYAGGGFGLYINSRTHLEGWDVDLAFRQLGSRLRARAAAMTPPPPLVLLLVAGFIFSLGSLSPAMAQAVDGTEAKSQIKEILTHPDFSENVKKYQSWEWDPTPPPTPRPEPEGWDWSWLTSIWNGLGSFFSGDWKDVLPRLLLALAITALLLWMGRLLWKHRASLRLSGPVREKDCGPRTVLGMDVTPESLPADIPSAAWSAWQAGDPAAAVRLLYRGALAWLMTQGTLGIRESDTEGDCLRHAGALPDAGKRAYFADLTRAWLSTAYGNSPPASAAMQVLCARWPFHSTPANAPHSLAPRPGMTALLFLALLCLTGCKGKWVEHEEELGYLGEAKRNPWLAATRFLELYNIPVLQQRGTNNLPDEQSVIITPAEAINSELHAQRLLDWTERGGHLIYLAEGGGHYLDDWSDSSHTRGMREGKHPLLATLGVKQFESSRGIAGAGEVRIGQQTFKVSLKEEIRFDLTDTTKTVAWSAGNPKESVFASLRSGSGRITLISRASAFRNRWIDDDDHAALLLALVRETDPIYSVTFVKAGRINLWHMLLQHAWPVLLALVLLLLFWLWSVLPRFGPVRALPRRFERRFASHLDEAGGFLWKQKLTDALLEAPRQAVLAAARRQGLREDERLFTALLATRAGLPPGRVQNALYAGNLTDGQVFTRHMADLQSLLTTLQFNQHKS